VHPEILAPAQLTVLDQLTRVPAVASFYLAGGTALALRHGHRRSVDFGFFTPAAFDGRSLLGALDRVPSELERLPGDDQTLYLRLSGVTTSFFHYPYPLIGARESTPWGFDLASDDDIAAMKIEAISGRGARKDFIDLRTLCARGWTLEAAFAAFDRKYGARRVDRYHRLRALAYFDDAEREPMPDMLVPFDWDEARRFFVAEATRILGTPP
jgi:hypothetical protein